MGDERLRDRRDRFTLRAVTGKKRLPTPRASRGCARGATVDLEPDGAATEWLAKRDLPPAPKVPRVGEEVGAAAPLLAAPTVPSAG